MLDMATGRGGGGGGGGELKPSIALESRSESHSKLTSWTLTSQEKSTTSSKALESRSESHSKSTSRTPTSQEKSTTSSKALASTSSVQTGSGASCLTQLQVYLHDLELQRYISYLI